MGDWKDDELDAAYSDSRDYEETDMKKCRRCGQVMPADCEPDGCRDPDCPVAK